MLWLFFFFGSWGLLMLIIFSFALYIFLGDQIFADFFKAFWNLA